jgi:hypothetical protein
MSGNPDAQMRAAMAAVNMAAAHPEAIAQVGAAMEQVCAIFCVHYSRISTIMVRETQGGMERI